VVRIISAIAGPNNPRAPKIIAGNVKTSQPNNITHIQKNHEMPRAKAKNFQGFAFEILVLILFDSFLKAEAEIYNGLRIKEVAEGNLGEILLLSAVM